MTENRNFSLDEAIANLRKEQERLKAARDSIQEVKGKVTSTDGMVTITLDGRGEISAITFNTTKFRRMAPAELGAALVEVIKKARTQAREQMLDAYRSFIPENVGYRLDDLIAGKGNLDAMFDDAIRRANNIMANGPTGDVRKANGTSRRPERPTDRNGRQ